MIDQNIFSICFNNSFLCSLICVVNVHVLPSLKDCAVDCK